MRATEIRPEHVAALLEAARGSRHSVRDVALVRLVADTGMRPQEAARLNWSALCDAALVLTGRCVWQTAKRGGVRDMTLAPKTLEALENLRQREAEFGLKLDKPVFLTERNGRFADQSMRAHGVALCAKAGLQASWYSLRHLVFDSAARVVVEAKGTAEDLRSFTGHKNISSVGNYLDKHSEVQARIMEANSERVAAY